MKTHTFFLLILISITSIMLYPENMNLIDNPGFENKKQGWDELWMREPGKGTMRIFSLTGKEEENVLEIDHSGSKDWSLGQKKRVQVEPGDVYSFSGRVQCENVTGKVQLSIVVYDRDNRVIDWLYCVKESDGTHGWKKLESRFIIPRNVASIQFRITGEGKGLSLWDDLSLIKIKNAPDSSLIKKTITLTNKTTTLTYSPEIDLIIIQTEGHTHLYKIKGFGDDVFITSIKQENNTINISIRDPYTDDISASVSLPDPKRILFSISGKGALETDFAFPGRLIAEDSQSWVIPQNEGLLVPADDPYYRPPWTLQLYQGHGGLSMPFIGLADKDKGIIFISETPDDNYITFIHPSESGTRTSGWNILWEPQMGKWGYERRLLIKLIDSGGYTGIAKAYRTYAEEKGLFVPLKQKRKTVPAVDLLAGAADVWWWDKVEWWTQTNDCTTIAKELKDAGMDRVLWSNQASPQSISDMNALGFLTGRYDIYQDVWDPKTPVKWASTEGWPEDLVLDKDGSWRHGWAIREKGVEYPGGVICSAKGFERMKKKVPEELKTHVYKARFIDTTTASPLIECYNPDHPITRSEDRKYKSLLLKYISGTLNLVAGSETGIDWAVPYLHYFEGMMSLGNYRLEDAGYDLSSQKKPQEDFIRFQLGPFYRIPLFELVYHDCVVSFWYWGDSSNRLPEFWQKRDLFNILYGTGPLYIMDRERWKKDKQQFIKSYKQATRVSRAAMYAEMLIHVFITADHTVQYSEFSNGTKVWVNFRDKSYALENGVTIKAQDYLVMD